MRIGFIALLLTGLAAILSVAQARTGWDPSSCWLASEDHRQVDCGHMRVRENRNSATGREISFPVVIMRSDAERRRDDPVVILGAGGPGIGLDMDQAAVDEYWDYYDWIFDSGRDLILLDPRGVGGADPALTCPEITEHMPMLWGSRLTPELENQVSAEAYARCRERWVKQGVALEHYNTRATAGDVAELRDALKIDQWNLYGTSYAATLAMTIMRDYPKGVRSVILDSVQAPDVRFFKGYAENVQGAFQTLFAACAANRECAADFPNLKAVLERVVRRLNDSPAVVSVAHPLTLEPFPLIVNGDTLIVILRSALYDENNFADLPMLIHALDRGSLDLLAPYARSSFQDDLDPDYADGIHLSVSCREEIPFNDMAEVVRDARALPMVAGAVRGVVDYYRHACSAWGVPPAAADELAPVRSAIPALVLGGEWDPVIPVKWASDAAAQLDTAHVFAFPATGHDVMAADYCAVILSEQFLDEPQTTPDDGCMDESARIAFNTLPFRAKPKDGRTGSETEKTPLALRRDRR